MVGTKMVGTVTLEESLVSNNQKDKGPLKPYLICTNY